MLTLANPNGFALLFFWVHAHHHFLDWIANSLTIGGSTLRARDGMTKQTIAAELEETVWPLFQSGDIAVVFGFRVRSRGCCRSASENGDQWAHWQDCDQRICVMISRFTFWKKYSFQDWYYQSTAYTYIRHFFLNVLQPKETYFKRCENRITVHLIRRNERACERI